MNNLKIRIREEYYKRSRPGYPVTTYEGRRKVDSNIASVVIKKDPILKKHPKIEKSVLTHEYAEIPLRYKKHKGRRLTEREAHKLALKKESPLTRELSISQVWRKLGKR